MTTQANTPPWLLTETDIALHKTQRDTAYRAYAQRMYGAAPAIVRQFGSWAVTAYGLECLHPHPYQLPPRKLDDQHLVKKMAGKGWVDMYDFLSALEAAKRYHLAIPANALGAGHITPALRFRILRRDSYRCQLCGRSAADGTTLEVDHKTARAKGGSNHPSNLWTLCRECNAGKSDDEL